MEYLTIEEVAQLLRTNIETIRHWRKTGKGPRGFKLGRRVLYDRAEVDAWIAGERQRQGWVPVG